MLENKCGDQIKVWRNSSSSTFNHVCGTRQTKVKHKMKHLINRLFFTQLIWSSWTSDETNFVLLLLYRWKESKRGKKTNCWPCSRCTTADSIQDCKTAPGSPQNQSSFCLCESSLWFWCFTDPWRFWCRNKIYLWNIEKSTSHL